jgi:hypothetical protein
VYSKGLNTVSVATFHTFAPDSLASAACSVAAVALSPEAEEPCAESLELEPQAVRLNNIKVASNIETVFFFITDLLK